MRATRPIVAAGLALVAAPAGQAIAPSAGAAIPPPGDAQARLVACHTAQRPADRRLEVEGEMRAFAAGQRLRMRFDLYGRRAGGAFRRVSGPGLGVFYSAHSGAGAYRFRKAVRNLPARDYRVTVTFQWLGQDGGVLARAARAAPVCRQPELRPDLRVAAIGLAPGAQPGRAVYEVALRNTGGSSARDFEVGLSVAGQPQPALAVSQLRPGERRTVRFDAPGCPPGAEVVAVADPERRLVEASESNNQRSLRCPAGSPGSP